jgi:hypothetical protein
MGEPAEEQSKTLPTEDISRRYAIEQERMGYGLLGKIFGSATNAPIYIAGIVIFLFSIICIVVLFVETRVPAADFLQVGIPLISLALGYLFGKST